LLRQYKPNRSKQERSHGDFALGISGEMVTPDEIDQLRLVLSLSQPQGALP
jgi:hypothetical protein